MSTETVAAPPVIRKIDEAGRIHRAVMDAPWPRSREARAAIGHAFTYAMGEVGVYCLLVSGEMDWAEFDADLMFFGGDPQREAIVIAEARALDAAREAMRRLAEHQRREAAKGGRAA